MIDGDVENYQRLAIRGEGELRLYDLWASGAIKGYQESIFILVLRNFGRTAWRGRLTHA